MLYIFSWVGTLSPSRMKVGFLLRNTLVLNHTAVIAKQLKRENSHSYHRQNNNPKTCFLWLPSPSLYAWWASSPWAPLIKATTSMQRLSLQNYGVSHWLSTPSIPPLFMWSNLIPSTSFILYSHNRVLCPTIKMLLIHIRSDFIPTKEIYGSPYPLIILTKKKRKKN